MSFIPKRSKNIVRQRFGTQNVRLSLACDSLNQSEETIKRVVAAPDRWRVIDEDVRRCLTHVFPYAILYTIEPDFILIVAVMHCSRAPGYWKQCVDER